MAFLLRGLSLLPGIVSRGAQFVSKIAPIVQTVGGIISNLLGGNSGNKVGRVIGNFQNRVKTIGNISDQIQSIASNPGQAIQQYIPQLLSQAGAGSTIQDLIGKTMMSFLNNRFNQTDFSQANFLAQRQPQFQFTGGDFNNQRQSGFVESFGQQRKREYPFSFNSSRIDYAQDFESINKLVRRDQLINTSRQLDFQNDRIQQQLEQQQEALGEQYQEILQEKQQIGEIGAFNSPLENPYLTQ